MKFLYIANIRIPTEKAHGAAVMRMCEAFANTGIKLELVVPKRLNPIKQDSFRYYGIQEGFVIRKLPTLDFVFIGRLGFLFQATSFAMSAFWYALLKRVDIIYGRDELSLFYLSLFKKNVVWEAHTAKDNWFVGVLLRRSKVIVVISKGLKDHYISLGARQEKILVAHSGVDLGVFKNIKESKEELRNKLGLPVDKKIIAYIGRRKTMGEDKGVEELETILNSLAQQDPKIHPLIVSEIHSSAVPQYMKAVDVLVMNYPNAEHYAKYMSPLKLFEYMASGTTIVTSDLPSIREVLNDSSAFFFEPDNAESLKVAIIAALNSKEDKAQNALKDVKKYSWEKRAKDILTFIT